MSNNSKKEKSKNDKAWEILFHKYNILDEIHKNGIYKISATVINEEREARLMTKFDHKIQLPLIFQDNHLTIQPDSRGTYIIGKFESYKDISKREAEFTSISEIPFPEYIETLTPTNIYSESASILCAYHAEIISDLVGEEVLFTVSGRMSTGRFSYSINNSQEDIHYEISVENSQCEIDGGFEGANVFAIIEAKIGEIDDILIRQLYYPYRLWTDKTSKPVIPIFMYYSNDIFSFYIYEFKDKFNYNSIELVKQKRYQIGSNDIELDDVTNILAKVKVTPAPTEIPFPQANIFIRIADLLMQIHGVNPVLSKEDIAINYAFNIRQAGYYADAARYLGLLQKDRNKEQGVFYSMTEKGHTIMAKTTRNRNLALVECIIEKEIFNKTLKTYLDEGGELNQHLICEIMTNENIGLSKSTIERRSSTVFGWVKWIMGLTQR
ncbi:MAG: hypothetical protein IM585_07895 [Pseudanabaena sp. M135S2SP2A07QC]|jgi:hypothetical protein|nr:hypothetical protein [Pseudanabaena sp. M090S1SP2A07QC]MCA6505004.1 hypothetical protein [Pseudanabaena sp. M172S2SP2A07QC]MCA6518070.1 hypothetical protein [Pseudanabaena sp. M110S1SP2A07QC]MCA6520508.1 hypothetical protein [Pseudanabaena sp. M051S1SP2A07QC]MCA6524915.1 hypothetical protein [Pseudanabaena sp. M179S2SP2A07QC]MCA6529329.1 hypothetical protein [Pseudanabaena sp. M125S2SP2A07QC]MCA6535092.1 hypothetical protein [Pseudanabaena sp. M176S2SP2A07QC]MCA6539225.1 hypothetical prot